MSIPNPEVILEGLRPVVDPELNLSIVELGLVRGITVEDESGDIQVDLTLTSPMCPMAPEIINATRIAALQVPGVKNCMVELVWSPPWDPRTDATEECRAELGIWD